MVGMIVMGRSRLHPTTVVAVAPAEKQDARSGASAPRRGGAEGPGVPMDVPEMVEPTVGSGMPPGYRSSNARNFMRMRLRELTAAEENFYNEAQVYTTDQSKLMLMRRTGDVTVVRVTFAGPAGWSAEATHPAMPGKSCVTYAGPPNLLPKVPETLTDRTPPLGERDLVCDKP
jgi:hypothetical protein